MRGGGHWRRRVGLFRNAIGDNFFAAATGAKSQCQQGEYKPSSCRRGRVGSGKDKFHFKASVFLTGNLLSISNTASWTGRKELLYKHGGMAGQKVAKIRPSKRRLDWLFSATAEPPFRLVPVDTALEREYILKPTRLHGECP